MSENILQIIAILKIVWVAGFAGLYGFGGISNKWLRRYVGSFWMGIGIFVFSVLLHSWHWWYLLYQALLCGALHIGYGGDELNVKIRKRFIYGLALGISAAPLLYPSLMLTLFGFHIILCIFASVTFGGFNPTKSARSEETLIGFLSTITTMYLIGG